ncbi:hypothetical protein CHUAL_012739 [Chamberlinius hualienensis]
MAPNPPSVDPEACKMPNWAIDEDIVISGISGRLPESDNIKEFRDHLINNEDIIAADDRRWPKGFLGLPERSGKLKDLTRFDAGLFGVNQKHANAMNPKMRILLEATYEAICDAGINPVELRGKRVGVFVGVCNTDIYEGLDRNPEHPNAYSLLGGFRAMFANRVSFQFDFTGPSVSVDSACSSSLTALNEAMLNIRSGRCDAAIVGGVNVNCRPTITLGFLRLGVLSQDGVCRTFDADAKGYVRCEAVVSLLLQKRSDARREYATILHTKLNADGYKAQGVTYPNGIRQGQLLREAYTEAGVDPKDVVYIECHGTGTGVGDPEELNNVASYFCPKDRTEPLYVGSLKSNIGHPEGPSGLASIIKLIIAMEEGVIPANLHFNSPNPRIPSLFDGSVEVVTRNIPFKGGIMGVNNFGWGGGNAHVILRSNPNFKKVPEIPFKEPLKLFTHPGRTQENLGEVLGAVEEDPTDRDLYTLLSFLSDAPYRTHPYRGYTIVNGAEPVREIGPTTTERKQLWYIFTGMGCQWKGMAREMMQLPPFRDTILRANDILKRYNISMTDLIYSEDDKIFDTLTNSTLCISLTQVGIVNTLKAIGVEPDGIIGHSVGELACAYADGCFTEEQLIEVAYWRSILTMKHVPTTGGMAAIGLTWDEAKRRLPENIWPACHNAEDNVTISGLGECVNAFVDQLTQEGVFARHVRTGGLAFHCKFIEPVAPLMIQAIAKFLQNPKRRSSRWLSTSVHESQWGSELAQYASAEYQINNLVSPVYFKEAMAKVPKDALVVEIGPHALLQAIVKRNLGPDGSYFPLQKRNQPDGLLSFLTQLGKLYIKGLDYKITNLYEPVPIPVPSRTKMISPLLKWDHSEEYRVVNFDFFMSGGKSQQFVEISIADEDASDFYLNDCAIDGRFIYPASGYIALVWKAFARIKGKEATQMPVIIENLILHQPTILNASSVTTLAVGIMDCGGHFEISEGGSLVATGKIYEPEDPALQYKDEIKVSQESSEYLKLKTEDFYKELRQRGYVYGPIFQNILEIDNRATNGTVRWDGNWVTFLDTLLQVNLIGRQTRGVLLPTSLEYLKINPLIHPPVPDTDQSENLSIVADHIVNIVASGGIEVKGLEVAVVNRRQQQKAATAVERYTYVPFNDKVHCVHIVEALKPSIDTILENINVPKVKAVEVGAADTNLYTKVLPIIKANLHSKAEVIVTDANTDRIDTEQAAKLGVSVIKWDIATDAAPSNIEGAHLVFGHSVLTSNKNDLTGVVEKLVNTIAEGGFLLLTEPAIDQGFTKAFQAASLQLIAEKISSVNSILYLLRKVTPNEKINVVVINDGEYDKWLEPIKRYLKSNDETLWLVAHDKSTNGIIGLANSLRHETGGNLVRAIYNPSLDASKAKQFLSDPVKALRTIYSEIIKKDLFLNVNKNGTWGTYRHLPLDQSASTETVETTDAYINILNRGDLSTLSWIESPLKKLTGSSTPHIAQIYYAAINYKDVLLASGKISPDAKPEDWANKDCLGMEFAGRDENGRRIAGIVPYRGLATVTTYDPLLKWNVPDNWTLEEAATVPLVYATVYYALVVRGDLTQRERVLIHSGSGGIGQAAIAVALSYDCEVFTTVGSEEKKEFLLKRFPKLKASNIFSSKGIAFENDIKFATDDKGVDIVLNYLSGERQKASMRILGKDGRFLEIGGYDLSSNTQIGMGLFIKNASFHGIFVDSLFDETHLDRQAVSELVTKGIKDGVVKPLTRHVYSKDEAETAFRFMASGKHIGKVLIKVVDEESQKVVTKPKKPTIKAFTSTVCSAHKSYIVTSGLVGFGLEISHWLVEHGARNLVVTSDAGIRDGYQSRSIRVWREQGVKVTVATHDISTIDGATKLVNEANALAPVGGIFNLTTIVRDAPLDNQTVEAFLGVANPKVRATSNLDVVSRKLAPQLDWFVVSSSLSSGRGTAGQTNLGYANSVVERIVEQRRQEGLHGLAVQWGAISDLGGQLEGFHTVIRGTVPQTVHSSTTSLATFLGQNHPVVSNFVYADKVEEQKKRSLVDIIANILGVEDIQDVNPTATLDDLGLGMITGVEIQQILERQYDLVVPINHIKKIEVRMLQGVDRGEPLPDFKATKGKQVKRKTSMEEEEIQVFLGAVQPPPLPDVLPTLKTQQ